MGQQSIAGRHAPIALSHIQPPPPQWRVATDGLVAAGATGLTAKGFGGTPPRRWLRASRLLSV